MTSIVDIFGSIVTGMIPTISTDDVVMARGGTIESVTASSKVLNWIFVGCNIKFTFAEGVFYGKVATIASDKFTVDITDVFAGAPTAVSLVLTYDHGHVINMVNRFKEASHSDTLKFTQFPAICLFQDIPEKHSRDSKQREVTLHIGIITSTKPEYTEAERYDHSFDPVLFPIYENLIDAINCSGYLQIIDEYYDYYERVYYGKSGLYGNTGNIFNDFIDAIEIQNLKVKIL